MKAFLISFSLGHTKVWSSSAYKAKAFMACIGFQSPHEGSIAVFWHHEGLYVNQKLHIVKFFGFLAVCASFSYCPHLCQLILKATILGNTPNFLGNGHLALGKGLDLEDMARAYVLKKLLRYGLLVILQESLNSSAICP